MPREKRRRTSGRSSRSSQGGGRGKARGRTGGSMTEGRKEYEEGFEGTR